jgi:hypothetical protein
MHANAGKHKAVSYKYAKEAIGRTEKEIEELIEKAEESDNTQNEVDIPEEIAFRERRKAVLTDAVTQMEEMYREVYEREKKEYDEKIKKGIESISKEAEKEKKLKVCADTGYFNGPLIDETEKEHPEVKIYCAVKREKHGRTPEKLFMKLPEEEPEENRNESMTGQKMPDRLKTVPGQEIYNRRKITVEPVFGIIKRVMKFRQFLTRGLDNISNEWTPVTLAYNFRRLFGLRNLKLRAA